MELDQFDFRETRVIPFDSPTIYTRILQLLVELVVSYFQLLSSSVKNTAVCIRRRGWICARHNEFFSLETFYRGQNNVTNIFFKKAYIMQIWELISSCSLTIIFHKSLNYFLTSASLIAKVIAIEDHFNVIRLFHLFLIFVILIATLRYNVSR